MSGARLGRMATLALDDGGIKRAFTHPHGLEDVGLEGTRNLHLHPNASFFLTDPKLSATAPKVEEDAISEDAEEEDEDPDSVYDCFSSRNPVTRWTAAFFGSTPTPAYMSLLALSLFLVITFQNLTADTRSSSLALTVYFLINTALLLAVFVVRLLWVATLHWIFEENRIVPALNEMIDPDLPILIWTLLMHMFWVSNTAQVFDEEGRKTGYHRIKFLPDSWPFQAIKDLHVTYLRLLQFVLMFWAIRNLLVEIIMFNILLGFLTNFRDSVLSYLGEYALLRKLNANWIKVVPPSNSPSVMSPAPAPILHQSSGSLLRRHSSLSAAFEEALARKQVETASPTTLRHMPATEAPMHSDHTKFLRMPTGTNAPSERKRRRKDKAIHVQYTGRALPTVLQNKNIKAVKQSALANLLSITFIRMNPMVLFVHGERCELKSRKVAKAVARLLFREIHEFQTSVAQIDQDLQMAEKTFIGDETAAFAAFQSPGRLTPQAAIDDIKSPDVLRGAEDVSLSLAKPQRGKVKITIQVPKGTFADRLAAELGVRNEEGLEDDETDEDVSDGENFKTIKAAVEGKPSRMKLPSPGVVPSEVRSVPAVDVDPERAVIKLRGQVRRRTAPEIVGDKTLNFHPMILERHESQRQRQESQRQEPQRQHYERLESENAGPPRKRFSSSLVHGSSLRRSHSLTSESDSLEAFAESEAPLMPLPQSHEDDLGSRFRRPHMGSPHQVRMTLTPEQVKRVVEAEIKAVNNNVTENKNRITKEFFAVFMSRAETESLMAVMDPGKHGSVSEKMFVKGVLDVHQKRRQMCTSLEAQKEIVGVFHRVTSYFLTFIMFLIFLLIAGVSTNTIIVSGAAALSASGVVLSFVYTDFIISIILIVFLNPYSIGDGVVVNDVYMSVRRITTYFTEFVRNDGKIFYVSHKKLTDLGIINQSRGPNAVFGLTVRVGDHMTPAQYAAFKRVIEAYLKSRPDMYKPNLFIHWLGLEPWHYVDINMWVTGMEAWTAPGTWIAKSELYAFVLRQTHLLGLTYKGVIQRWQTYADTDEKKRLEAGSGEAPRALVVREGTHGRPPPGVCGDAILLDLSRPLDGDHCAAFI